MSNATRCSDRRSCDLGLKLMNGQPIVKEALTDETVYYPDKATELLPTRKY